VSTRGQNVANDEAITQRDLEPMYAAINRKLSGANGISSKLMYGAAVAATMPIVVLLDNYYFVGQPNAFDLPSPAEWTLILGCVFYFGYAVFTWLGLGKTYNAATRETFHAEPELDIADRLLLPLVSEVKELLETAERIGVQVRTMAECRGIEAAE
jgi:hypothetical protein